AHSRRGPAPPQPAQTKPSSVKDLLAEVTVSYDDPDNFNATNAADEPAEADRAPLSSAVASGGRAAEDGLGTPQMPTPAHAPPARAPRAKQDYSKLTLSSVRQFAGQTIKVVLTIDERGAVSDVRVLQGIEPHLDRRTVALTRAWQFDPALDDFGTPIPGTS